MATPKKKQIVQATFPEPADKAKANALADLVLRPSVNAAAVVEEYSKAAFGEQDIGALAESLAESIEEASSGNMKRCEAMLLGQAHALQSIFMSLSRRAIKQEYLKQYETYLRLALKAQGQCRATLETLAAIKNPPVVFAKQANIAHGPQQVNNGTPQPGTATPHAREEKTIQPNELLTEGGNHGPALDSGRTATASGTDKELATVGKIHRAENGKRKRESFK